MQGGLLIAFPKQEGYTHRPAFALVGDFLPHVAPIRQLADRSYVGLYILTNNSICILPALEYNYSDNLNQYTLLIRLNSERGWNSDLYKGNMSTFNTIATIILTVFFVSGCVYFGTNHCANPKCGSWRTYLDDFIINDKKMIRWRNISNCESAVNVEKKKSYQSVMSQNEVIALRYGDVPILRDSLPINRDVDRLFFILMYFYFHTLQLTKTITKLSNLNFQFCLAYPSKLTIRRLAELA